MRILVMTVLCVFFAGGCFNVKEYDYVVKQNSDFRTQNGELQKQVASLQKENEQLKGQVQKLSGISERQRYENLNAPESIEVYRLTGIYVTGKDGGKELIVYIVPRDSRGDAIKAAGDISVQLWNLAGTSENAMVAQWEVGADKLKQNWGVSMLTGYYRLNFDLPAGLAPSDFMVKVSFTDFLTGKVLTTTGNVPIKK